jgi:hypothetical protein
MSLAHCTTQRVMASVRLLSTQPRGCSGSESGTALTTRQPLPGGCDLAKVAQGRHLWLHPQICFSGDMSVMPSHV